MTDDGMTHHCPECLRLTDLVEELLDGIYGWAKEHAVWTSDTRSGYAVDLDELLDELEQKRREAA
jgi:hypothetical protein